MFSFFLPMRLLLRTGCFLQVPNYTLIALKKALHAVETLVNLHLHCLMLIVKDLSCAA